MLNRKQLALHKTTNGQGTYRVCSSDYILANLDALKSRNIALWVVSTVDNVTFRLGNKVVLENYEQVTQLREQLSGKLLAVPLHWQELPIIDTAPAGLPQEVDSVFVRKFKEYTLLAPEQRVAILRETCQKLMDSRRTKTTPDATAEVILAALQESVSVNKVVLTLAYERGFTSVADAEIIKHTQAIEENILAMIADDAVTKSLFSCFKTLSNGQTLNHCLRVTTTLAGFMFFYNNLIQHRVVDKLRIIFTQYMPIYKRLFPQLDEYKLTFSNLMSLEAIASVRMLEWLHGAHFHDIGKAVNINYFESNMPRDQRVIEQHVIDGQEIYSASYGDRHAEAKLMIGDHHYALRKGYFCTRFKQPVPAQRCVTGKMSEYLSGAAVSFLPIEILAVIDIYDALTDSSREYKRAMTPLEALNFMYENNVLTGRLDPIIFDLFVDFLRAQNVVVPENLGFSVKYAKHKKASVLQ